MVANKFNFGAPLTPTEDLLSSNATPMKGFYGIDYMMSSNSKLKRGVSEKVSAEKDAADPQSR